SVDGLSITTSDSVYILSKGAILAELVNVAFEVEQFLALLCIGPFRGERVTLNLDMIHKAELIWKLGKQHRSGRFSLMPHQMLVPLGRHPGLARQALERWFAASEATRLARWLIFDALFTEVSSTSKFLSVAQAWEIAGREESKAAPYNKQKFKEACREVEKIFNKQLGEDAAKRLLQLLRSSNRESFANFVQNMIKNIPQLALDHICKDQPNFISAVVKTRNVLTHMQDTKNLPIELASYLSLFLTYKLIVLYCIHACITVGLPLENLAGMLGNNTMAQTACRPLPSI
ncbi:HEPN domain-containing protein, partial [Bradyrhizobium jicamae]|uniref:HEPN domain-containing protein n=1 Tax=Bradyrhizobium jicamae TaxID=280332 RepID=UPI000A8339BF